MKVGLKSKKFFHDIVLIPRSEMEQRRLEIEKHREKKRPQLGGPLVFDTVLAEDRIKKGISRIWNRKQIKKREKDLMPDENLSSLEEVAERVISRKAEVGVVPPKRIKPKTLLKNSLILFLEFVFVALMIYNAITLYFDKNWLVEKLNNLSIASKAHFAFASESLSNLDRNKSTNELERANLNLLQIKSELISQGEYSYILPNHPMLSNELTLGQNMLELGFLIRDTNNDLNTILDMVSTNQSTQEDLLQKVNNLKPIISRIDKRINRADIILKTNQDVKNVLGLDTGTKIADIINKSKTELDKIKKVMDIFPLILGENGDNAYLVMFLNNAEMRPGGGFPGNYGVISFAENKFQNLEIDDIYYLEWLKKDEIAKLYSDLQEKKSDPRVKINLPQELYLSKPMDEITGKGYFTLFASNWNLDFRNNAKRAIFLYKNLYQQEDVKGLVALTPDVVEEILGIIGPIKMDNYGVEINKENFRETIEYKVEVDNAYKKENRKDIKPKQILADFGPLLMEKMSGADLSQKIKIFQAILVNIREKQIMLYHVDPQVESLISEFGASGEIAGSEGDSLGIYQINLNAMKNGRMIDNRANFKSNISSLGFAMDELSLTIINNESNPRFLHDREEGYYEILVPQGSRMREARIDGKDFIGEIDYFEEASHTVFGFKISLEPGEAKNIFLKYQAPLVGFSDKGYSLNVFKQAGAKPIEFEGEINFEDNSEGDQNPILFKRAIDTNFVVKK